MEKVFTHGDQAGIAVAVVNPRQVRDFAKGHGFLEKSDRIDARMIMKFGQDVDVVITPPKSEQSTTTPTSNQIH